MAHGLVKTKVKNMSRNIGIAKMLIQVINMRRNPAACLPRDSNLATALMCTLNQAFLCHYAMIRSAFNAPEIAYN